MQSNEFEIFIDKFPCVKKHWLGVFSLNTIPSSVPPTSCLVFNEEPDHLFGSHWIALVRTHGSEYQLFNSLGCKFETIEPWLKFKKPIYSYNKEAFQLPTTNTCGLYCLYFIVHRMMSLELSYKELLSEIFEINTEKNEHLVRTFWTEFE